MEQQKAQLPILTEYTTLAHINLTTEQLNLFIQFKKELLEWNEKTNLTGITDDRGIELKHFADSLSLLHVNNVKEADYIIDMGTGAGFPGIPLAIILPKTHIILIESIKKKVDFLEHVVKVLGLKNISIKHGRTEDVRAMDLVQPGKKTVLTARAVSELKNLIDWSFPFLKRGVVGCFQKSAEAVEKEITELEQTSLADKCALNIVEIPDHNFPELKNRVVILCHIVL